MCTYRSYADQFGRKIRSTLSIQNGLAEPASAHVHINEHEMN